MSKAQKGNKEAKKPKQAPGMKPVVPALASALETRSTSGCPKPTSGGAWRIAMPS